MFSKRNSIFRQAFLAHALILFLVFAIIGALLNSAIIMNAKEASDTDFEMYVQSVHESASTAQRDLLNINNQIYYDEQLSNDMDLLLDYPINSYLTRRLDAYSKNTKIFEYKSLSRLFSRFIFSNEQYQHVYLYSNIQNKLLEFSNDMLKVNSYDFTLSEGNKSSWEQLSDKILSGSIDKPIYPTFIDVKQKETNEIKGTLVLITNVPEQREFCLIEKQGVTVIFNNCDSDADHVNDLSKFKQILTMEGGEIVSELIINKIIYGLSTPLLLMNAVLFVLFGLFLLFIYRSNLKQHNRMELLLNFIRTVDIDSLTLQVDANITKQDQIHELYTQFNRMLVRVDDSIKTNYKLQRLQASSEMKMLQSQIDPHFLYNTLEVIRMKAVIDNNADLAKMLYSLATLFRDSVKAGELVKLEKEFELLEQYIELFILRYPGKLQYEIAFDPQLKDYHILKFITQPIVENSLKYAFDYSNTTNKITVAAEKIGNFIRLSIQDNGRGIPDDVLATLQHAELADDVVMPIGIKNIKERVKLYYKSFAKVIISSSEAGTCVSIIIAIGSL